MQQWSLFAPIGEDKTMLGWIFLQNSGPPEELDRAPSGASLGAVSHTRTYTVATGLAFLGDKFQLAKIPTNGGWRQQSDRDPLSRKGLFLCDRQMGGK